MIRKSRSSAGIAAAIGAALMVAIAVVRAQDPLLLHPKSDSDRPIVIAVLADNFTREQSEDFNEAAANFLVHGLLADAFYGAHESAFTIKTVFKPESNYGFKVGNFPGSNCSVSWDNGTNTAAAVETDADDAGATHIVVIGNYHYNFGCQHANWIYVARGAVGQQVLQHELGHSIGGLFDEYALAKNVSAYAATAPPSITRANCSSKKPAPHWQGIPGVTYQYDCALFPNIYHAFESCRMGRHGRDFCPVCKREMEAELGCLENAGANPKRCGVPGPSSSNANPMNPFVLASGRLVSANVLTAGFAIQQPAQDAAGPLLRMLVKVDTAPNSTPVTILSANDSTARYVPKTRRLGDYVYEVTEKGTTTIGVLPSNPFEVREHSGGLTEHRETPTSSATFLISIPNVTRSALVSGSRAVGITLYRLRPDAGNEPITSARLGDLRKKGEATVVVQISPADVQNQLKGMPPANQRPEATKKPPEATRKRQ